MKVYCKAFSKGQKDVPINKGPFSKGQRAFPKGQRAFPKGQKAFSKGQSL
jgi:hypothetical protein